MARESEQINKYGQLHIKMEIRESSNNLNVNVLEYKALKKSEGFAVVVHLLPGSRKPIKQKCKFDKSNLPVVFQSLTTEEIKDSTVVIRVQKKVLFNGYRPIGEVQVPLQALPIDEWKDLQKTSSAEGEKPELTDLIYETIPNQGRNRLPEHEGYLIPDQNILSLLEEPWRKVREDNWTEEVYQSLKKEILRHEHMKAANVKQFNILLLGEISSGKSSFINTVNSVFASRVSSKAIVGGGGKGGGEQESVTKYYRKYKVRAEEKGINFTFCDTMGLEGGDEGMNVADVANILDGRVNDLADLTAKGSFNLSPNERDKIHLVAIVVDSASLDFTYPTIEAKLNLIKDEVNHRYLSSIIIMTHVDDVCMEVKKDITKVYLSRAIKEKVDDVCRKFGVKENMVYPVQNYTKETDKVTGIEILNLRTLHRILELSKDFLEDKRDRDKEVRRQHKSTEKRLDRENNTSDDDESEEYLQLNEQGRSKV